ncbi:hypothetical protein [Jannaschia pohangensis]|uniref:Uncharacterized protein n=1 Tax=Jannaschia pohangensis TaxID=390807 RepID=A0A1I3I5N4_9RHOB|nr:hypothetical protein [Jannaschia pohangensis]SFI43295.1 hypothetical protein SAMN04488095_0826 [Jannaschia pohangensis]
MRTITLESFGSGGYEIVALIVIGGIALVALVAIGGLVLMVRKRGVGRLIGAALVFGVLALLIGPWLSAQIPARQQAARIEAASFWPETLDLSGRHVLVIRNSSYCDFCTPLVTRTGAASVYLAYTDLMDWTDDGWPGLSAWRLPLGGGVRLVPDPAAEPAYGYPDDPGLDWQEAPVPDRVDIVISLDEQDFFVATQRTTSGLGEEDALDVRWSLHVYEVPGGQIGNLTEADLVARMMQVRPDIPRPFFPITSDAPFLPDGAGYDAVLSRWFCGTDAAPDCVDFFPG